MFALNAYSEVGEDAIAFSVASATLPNPRAMILVPEALMPRAAAMAVLSPPRTVWTPSDITTRTFGTPLRALVPVTTCWPSSRPPERYVELEVPPALSMPVEMALRSEVRLERVTVLATELNSTIPSCAASDPIVKKPTMPRANSSTCGRSVPTLEERSITMTRSMATEQGGGACGGDGGEGGGGGTTVPHSCTASISSYPLTASVEISTVLAFAFDARTWGPTLACRAEPQVVLSVPDQTSVRSPSAFSSSTCVTNGAAYVS